MHPAALIDHVIVNARDGLDDAASRYAALGFTLTPRGRHTLGSINHLAVFGTDYLELLGVPPGESRTDVLEWPAGLNGLVFKTGDSDALYAALRAAGAPVLAPQAFSRPVDLDGAARTASFRTVRVTREAAPSGRMFFCHHLTPEVVWRDAWREHANGAVGILGMLIAAEAPGELAALFSRLFGRQAVREHEMGCSLVAGLATVEVMNVAAMAARLGDAAPAPAGRPQFMAALSLRTSSLARTRASIADAAAFEDGVIVPARSACGAALIFRL